MTLGSVRAQQHRFIGGPGTGDTSKFELPAGRYDVTCDFDTDLDHYGIYPGTAKRSVAILECDDVDDKQVLHDALPGKTSSTIHVDADRTYWVGVDSQVAWKIWVESHMVRG